MTLFLYTSSSSSSSSSSPLSILLFFLKPPPQKACAGVSLPFSPTPPLFHFPFHSPLSLVLTPLTLFLLRRHYFCRISFSRYLRLSFFRLHCTRGYICSSYINTKKVQHEITVHTPYYTRHPLHPLSASICYIPIYYYFLFSPWSTFTSISIAFDSLACPHCSPVSILVVSLLLQDDLGTLQPFPSRNRLRWEGEGKRGTALLYKYFCRVWRT